MRKQLVIAFVMLAGSACFFAISLPVSLRAANPSVNYIIFSIFCLVPPASIALAGLAIARKWLKILTIAIATVVAVPSGVISLMAANEAIRIHHLGHDPWLEPINEASEAPYRYRLYRTNCGATCAYGLELRKERQLPLGLKLVRPLWSFYGAEEGTVTVHEEKIEISFEGQVAKVAK